MQRKQKHMGKSQRVVEGRPERANACCDGRPARAPTKSQISPSTSWIGKSMQSAAHTMPFAVSSNKSMIMNVSPSARPSGLERPVHRGCIFGTPPSKHFFSSKFYESTQSVVDRFRMNARILNSQRRDQILELRKLLDTIKDRCTNSIGSCMVTDYYVLP